MQNNSKDLITILKKERELLNLTKNQLAQKVNVSHTSIARIENEEMNPTLSTFIKIANELGYNLILQKLDKEQENNIQESINEKTETTNTKRYIIIKKKKY